ncbi:MAG: hypothetical protein RBU45_03925 [Myxococcota bacterium]|jgi:hypothetical protein|nr:hypothetical protein [Myxococcota bacterium]
MVLRLLAGLLLLAPATAAATSWELVAEGQGVQCYLRQSEQTGLPVVRSVTRVEAPLAETLAVIADVDDSCSWAGSCRVARIVQRQDPTRFRLYTLRQAPPLVRDRDVELDVSIEIEPGGKQVWARFTTAPDPLIPIPSGVVRMPLMRGHYRLRALGPELTEVEFLVEGDPGGLIPRWVLPWAARAVPYESLKALRTVVPQRRGRYPELVGTFEALTRATTPASR